MASPIPANRAAFTRDELCAVTGGECGPFAGTLAGVFTDSRAEPAGQIFVALRGENFDGHRFVEAAVERGARVVIVERPISPAPRAAVLQVPSTLRALGDLARHHRTRWRGKVAAVAGSVGKTTTRSALGAVLAGAGVAVHSPAGNLNNLIGVPMVLLGLDEQRAHAVVEIGTSVSGEVAALTRIAQPDVAVLTRVALEHSEGLGDLDAIEEEEGALLAGLEPQAIALTNADDPRCLRRLEASPARRRLCYGLASSGSSRVDYRFRLGPSAAGGRSALRLQRPAGAPLELSSPLLGLPGAYALTAAIAGTEALLGRALDRSEVERALTARELGEPGRLTPVELADGSLVLDDTYNSSPASLESSIDVAAEIARERRGRLLLVLGEMRELGELSERAHREVGERVAAAEPALVVAFGGDAELLLESARERGLDTRFAADAASALPLVLAARKPGDVVLVKASRSLRAERIVAALADARNLPSPAQRRE